MRDSKRDTDVKNRLLDSVGEGEGGMIWENGIETCILPCKKRIASLGSIQDTGCLGLMHWDDPERWYGEGGGRGVQGWDLMYTCGGFMSMYGKTNTVLQNKKKEKKLKKRVTIVYWEEYKLEPYGPGFDSHLWLLHAEGSLANQSLRELVSLTIW